MREKEESTRGEGYGDERDNRAQGANKQKRR